MIIRKRLKRQRGYIRGVMKLQQLLTVATAASSLVTTSNAFVAFKSSNNNNKAFVPTTTITKSRIGQSIVSNFSRNIDNPLLLASSVSSSSIHTLNSSSNNNVSVNRSRISSMWGQHSSSLPSTKSLSKRRSLKSMPLGHFISLLSMVTSVAPLWGVASVTNALDLFTESSVYHTDVSTKSNTLTPVVEGEILSGLAHVALDLLTFGGPATVIVRLGAVFGRICSMAADYVPDQTVVPQELVFQCIMLTVAWFALIQSLVPLALSTFAYHMDTKTTTGSDSNTTNEEHATKVTRLRDRKAYSLFFESSGFTWNQYKAMSVCAFDWIKVSPGEVISNYEDQSLKDGNNDDDSDDNVYWLYKGSVELLKKNKPVMEVKYSTHDGPRKNAGRGILGEHRLLNRMLEKESNMSNKKKKYTKTTNNIVDDDHDDETSSSKKDPWTMIRANGDTDTILLRIHIPNLLILMDTDPQLLNSFRTLLLNTMQSKLHAHLQEQDS